MKTTVFFFFLLKDESVETFHKKKKNGILHRSLKDHQEFCFNFILEEMAFQVEEIAFIHPLLYSLNDS